MLLMAYAFVKETLYFKILVANAWRDIIKQLIIVYSVLSSVRAVVGKGLQNVANIVSKG